MAANPQYLTLKFVKVAGPNKGQVLAVNAYGSDVTAAKIKYADAGGKASSTSNDYWDAPSDSPVVLTDIVYNATTTDCLYIQPIVAGQSINQIYSVSTLLASLNNRFSPQLGLNAGARLQFNQLA